MKKSKIALVLMTSLLAGGSLAACSPVSYDEKGVILTYTGKDGVKEEYTAEDLFYDQLDESTKWDTVFKTIYKLVVKNYFLEVEEGVNGSYGKAQLAGLKKKAEQAVTGDKETAEKNREKNGTSYDEEFSKILNEKNCKDEDELYEYYLYTYEKERFDSNFDSLEENLSILKSGTAGTDQHEDNPFTGYFESKVPYHVSHILVKIDDSGSTNYADASISKANANKLFSVADALAHNYRGSFAGAAQLSDDTKTGDLGLVDMDKTDGYIAEFKYALYAFENFYGKTTEAQASNIKVGDKTKYDSVNHLAEDDVYIGDDKPNTLSSEGFSVIPFGAFEILKSNAERETGALDQQVNDGEEKYFPRNIFFNHYLNRHSFALVSPFKAGKTIAGDDTYYDKITDEFLDTFNDLDVLNPDLSLKEGTGFHDFSAADGVTFTGKYLATTVRLGDNTLAYRPILVVRGGSAGEGGYQGIHFIVVNRSPFEYRSETEVAGDTTVATLEKYYTTHFPGETGYPTDVNVNYVNFSKDSSTYQTRAKDVLTAIKGFNSDGLEHFIFRKYLKAGRLEIKDEKISAGLEKWMTRSEQNKDYNSQTKWENNWKLYLENLSEATSIQSKKAVAKGCGIYFSNHTYGVADVTAAEIAQYKVDHPEAATWSDDEVKAAIVVDPTNPKYAPAWDSIGGVCNNGKKHS